jgi:hypothetical protein
VTDLAAPPSDFDHLIPGRLPVAPPDLAGLTGEWHLWPDWTVGMWPALARHLDGDDTTGRYVAAVPFAFTWAITWGYRRLAQVCHEDRWCYHTRTAAVAAAHVWDGTGEPVGWHRHPTTGRRRPDGDPTREYIDP